MNLKKKIQGANVDAKGVITSEQPNTKDINPSDRTNAEIINQNENKNEDRIENEEPPVHEMDAEMPCL